MSFPELKNVPLEEAVDRLVAFSAELQKLEEEFARREELSSRQRSFILKLKEHGFDKSATWLGISCSFRLDEDGMLLLEKIYDANDKVRKFCSGLTKNLVNFNREARLLYSFSKRLCFEKLEARDYPVVYFIMGRLMKTLENTGNGVEQRKLHEEFLAHFLPEE